MHSELTRKRIGDALRRPYPFDCDYCGSRRYTTASKFARKRRHFCNRSCYSRFRTELLPPEEHFRWRGGITRETQRGRGTKKYKAWQQAVFYRDNRTCIWCGATDNLEADHIFRWSEYPELRYELSNGRTLCMICHNKTRNKSFYEDPELLKEEI